MTEYEREQAQKLAAFSSLLKSIASHLDGWKIDYKRGVNVFSGIISGPNGLGMLVRNDDNRQKLQISGCWPRTTRGEVFYPRDRDIAIGVSSWRDPEDIARDIERRLLPAYEEEYKRQEQFVRDAETEVERICQDVTEIADVFGVSVDRGMSDDPRGLRIHYDAKDGRATFEHRYAPEFEITIRNASLDLSLDIAQLLKERETHGA